jgi:farnesyl-diphosphate farnesyltransferase
LIPQKHGPFLDPTADPPHQTLQIEQFIESIFPSQTATTYRKGAPPTTDQHGIILSDEEQEKIKKQQAQDKEEFFYIMLAVGATLLVVTCIMVCLYSLPFS